MEVSRIFLVLACLSAVDAVFEGQLTDKLCSTLCGAKTPGRLTDSNDIEPRIFCWLCKKKTQTTTEMTTTQGETTPPGEMTTNPMMMMMTTTPGMTMSPETTTSPGGMMTTTQPTTAIQ